MRSIPGGHPEILGFGQSGPYAARAAFNPVGLAFGGMTYLNGFPDRPPCRDGVTAGDYSTAPLSTCSAWWPRSFARPRRGGSGRHRDVRVRPASSRRSPRGAQRAGRPPAARRRRLAALSVEPHVEAVDGRFVAVSAAGRPELAAACARLHIGGPVEAPCSAHKADRRPGGRRRVRVCARPGSGERVNRWPIWCASLTCGAVAIWCRSMAHGEIRHARGRARAVADAGRLTGWSHRPGRQRRSFSEACSATRPSGSARSLPVGVYLAPAS